MAALVLSSHMGEAIISRLRDFAEIPEEGYLAGQAVASAISELFGDGRAVVYNDIDIFRKPRAGEVGVVESRVLSTCQYFEEDFTYKGCWEEKVSYNVLRSTRKELLNDVLCEFHNGLSGIIGRFDMNCVQVGVNLTNKRLLWTPAFEEFTRTRQIEIVGLATPFHSLIRYFKKRRELEGTYGNDERMLELIAAAHAIYGNEASGHVVQSDAQWRIGALGREKLEAVRSDISSCFNIYSEELKGYTVTRIEPRSPAGADLVSLVPRRLVKAWLPRVSRVLREKHKPGVLERLKYVTSSLHEREQRYLTKKFAISGESFFKGNVTAAQAAAMDAVVSQHQIEHVIKAQTLGEEWSKFHVIQEAARKHGKWVYGVVENMYEFSPEDLLVQVDKTERNMRKQLVTPLIPELAIDGYRCKELVSSLELMKEGEALHHCVGGYGWALESGRSRIWSIRPEHHSSEAATWLTVELGKTGNGWALFQLYGLCNRKALPAELKVAQELRARASLFERLGPRLGAQALRYAPKMSLRVNTGVEVVERQVSQLTAKLRRQFWRYWFPPTRTVIVGEKFVLLRPSQLQYWYVTFQKLLDKVKGTATGLQRGRLSGESEDIPF